MSGSETLIYHVVEGEGPALLFLNGIAMTVASWGPVAEGLRGRFTVIRCDMRGQLLTPGPVPGKPEAHVDDLLRLLDHLGRGSVHILSTSFGGVIGALLAARHPDRVSSLTIVASADRFDAAMTAEVGRWRAACQRALTSGDAGHLVDVMTPVVYSQAYIQTHGEMLGARRDQMQRLPARWFQDLDALMASVEEADLSAELGSISCPTLIVASERDGFIPLARTRGMADAIPDADFVIIPGAGHAVVVENPNAVLDLMARIDLHNRLDG